MISKVARLIGWLWGVTFLRYVVLAYTRSRVSRFDIHTVGLDNLDRLRGQSYILVSNHIRERDTLLKIFTLKPLRRFNHAIDSFVLQKVVYEHAHQWVWVVAKYGRDSWHQIRLLRFLQRHVRQPLTQGQLEGVGYVPVDLKTGTLQRDFLKAVDRIIRRQGALLVFPEGNVFGQFESERDLRTGAAHLAHKHKIPILPAYITGCDSWRPGQRVNVRFGPSISTEGLSKQQIIYEVKRHLLTLQDIENSEQALEKV